MKQIRVALIVAVACLATPFVGLKIYQVLKTRERSMYDFIFSQPVQPVRVEIMPDRPFVNSVGMRFVYIPAGKFMMGSPSSEFGRRRQEIRHEVHLSRGFYLQTTEVTQTQWQKVMQKNISKFKGDDLPVHNISWLDSTKFVQRLNQLEGDTRYRLPSEAEWEYACRAGSRTAVPTGNLRGPGTGPDPALNSVAWYKINAGQRPHQVATKSANKFGLFDMNGNVWEWNQDWWHYFQKFADQVDTDPTGPQKGRSKVVRGGSWFAPSSYQRCAARMRFRPDYRSQGFGLRVARSE